MDNIQKLDIVGIELNSGTLHRSWLNHSIGTGDNRANRFGMRVFRDGQPVSLSGASVQGYFKNSQGTNIAISSGTVSGNVAYVTLPQACYNYEGVFTLAIKVIGDNVTETMRIVDGMVDNTNSGNAVAPTGTVPTYQEVLAVYEQMVAKNGEIEDIKSAIDKYPYSLYDSTKNETGKWLDANGVVHSQTGWDISEYLKIGASAKYYIKTRVTSDNVKSCFYDSNKNFLSAFITANEGENYLTPVENARFVRFSIQSADASDFKYSSLLFLEKIEGVAPEEISGSQVVKTFRDDIITGSYYGEHGGIVDSANWSRTQLYEFNKNDVVSIVNAQALYAILFDSSRTAIGSKSSINAPSQVEFIVPENVKYIGFNILTANLSGYSCLVNGITLGASYKLPWLNVVSQNDSIWKNKTYISHGDSITWQDGHTWGSGSEQGQVARGYQTVFSESVGLKSYNNQGKSGWSMAVVNGNGVVNTIQDISDYTIYDLCTIACGTNDFKLNVPIGTKGKIGDTTFDDTTFYGAYRKAVEYILTRSPTIRLVLITPIQRDNSGYDVNYTNNAGAKLIDYVNAVKEIGEMYGLPVCDMYGNSGFTKKTLATYTLDGLHPNTVGYVRMGNYLTGFLNSAGN